MKRVYPAYYPHFRCTADRCAHTCCQGWEIDIDRASLRRYRKMPGPMGERLRAVIAEDAQGAHFILDAEERCPLLSASGLCDLITGKGEKALCQICRDHPRFRTRLKDREEIGLGLCCEAACALILGWEPPFRLLMEDDHRSGAVPTRLEEACIAARQKLLELPQASHVPVRQAVDVMLAEYYGLPLPHTHRYWAKYFLRLERMEPAWTDRLTRLAQCEKPSCALFRLDPQSLRNLYAYFVYRYAVPGWKKYRYGGHIAFIALSIRMIVWLCETPEEICEIARQYSAEIEYSDVNANQLIEKLERYAEVHQ